MTSSLGVWPHCWGYVAALSFLAVVATFAVALRFWSRWSSGPGAHWDDWLALVGLVIHHGLCATILTAFLAYGLGFDAFTLLTADYHSAMQLQKIVFIGTILYGAGWTTTRLSLVLFYLRIFPTKTIRRGTYIIAALSVCWFIAVEALNLATCRPIAFLWNRKMLGGHCITSDTGSIVLGAFNVAINAALVGLPVHDVFQLHMSREKRFLILGIFVIGVLSTGASIARVVATSVHGNVGASVSATAGFEVYIAIIGTSALTLLPVYKRLLHRPTTSDTPIPSYSSKPSKISQHPFARSGPMSGASRTALRDSDDESQLTKGLTDVQILVPPKERGGLWTDISARPNSGRMPCVEGIRVQRDVTWNSESWQLESRNESCCT